jgi:hypothetical protein
MDTAAVPPQRPRLVLARPFIVLGTLLLVAAACTSAERRIEARVVDMESDASWESPTRAYLLDGSVVVLPQGATVEGGWLRGAGARFDLTLASEEAFREVLLDSVLAVEAFRERDHYTAQSAVLIAGSIAASAVAVPALLVAIFGSCPTVYAVDQAGELLEMEAFSYSIAPLFESRDVARLMSGAGEDGILRLEVRNEALETHYIRNTELIEVRHSEGVRIAPGPGGVPVASGLPLPPRAAHDRAGRDVLQAILAMDGDAFRTSPEHLAAAGEGDFGDQLELLLPVPEGADEVLLHLRARNTLLTSVLFYDVMLAGSGAAAVDWLGGGLDRIGTALEMGTWYAGKMGMGVEVEGPNGWEEVHRLPDTGPIAWKELVVPLPARESPMRVRLDFVADSWLIDWVGVAAPANELSVRRIEPSRVLGPSGDSDPAARKALLVTDTTHLVIFPGDRRTLEFDVGADRETGVERTFLLGMQGYYVEWIRGSWLAEARHHEPFRPDDGAIVAAIGRWREVMEDFERDFHASRIPTIGGDR